jgi:4-hydroxy-tetrahydrodipicolinate synthase
MNRYKGAITAIVTPFTEKGTVDVPALEQLVEFQITEGIDGIVACGSTGEAATLTIEEYSIVVSTIVKQANGRVPVIAGAGSNDTQKAILFSQLAQKAGAECLLHATPYYNKPTLRGLIAHFQEIAKAVELPIILYNVPSRTGQNVTSTMTLKIVQEVPSIVGIKEASGNISQVMDIIHHAPKNFVVLSGDDALTLPMMVLGAVGCISVVANEVPKEFTAMTHAALDGDWKKAQKIHYHLLDLMNTNFIETNPIPVKTALAAMGKIHEVFRLPLIGMEQKNTDTLLSVLKGLALV